MNIHFSIVDTEIGVYGGSRDTLVLKISLCRNVQTMGFARDHLEEAQLRKWSRSAQKHKLTCLYVY